MSTASTTDTIMTSASAMHTAKPSFLGMLRGELFKVPRQWITWIMAVLLLGIITLPYLVRLTVPDIKNTIDHTALQFFYQDMESDLTILRAFGGIFLLVLTPYVIGLEYQLGTI